jgi:hypothetical protein
MHRISDNRISGTTKRNITMFKSLIGEDSYSNVAILTTMWSPSESHVNARREAQLSSTADFFGDILAGGARMFRHDVSVLSSEDARARSSALEVINYLIEQARAGPATLQVQSELVDDRLPLSETSAGKILVGSIADARKDFLEQLALARQDRDAANSLRELATELRQKEKEMSLNVAEMQATLLQLHEKEKERLAERMAEMEAQWNVELSYKVAEIKELEDRFAHMRAEAECEAARRKDEEIRARQLAEIEKAQRELEEMQRALMAKQDAVGRVRRGLNKGDIVKGLAGGVASGVMGVGKHRHPSTSPYLSICGSGQGD